MAAVLKTAMGLHPSWVRIPRPPPHHALRHSAVRQCRHSASDNGQLGSIHGGATIDTRRVAKHLIDLDEAALDAARAELGTATIKDTVNEALRRASRDRARDVVLGLDVIVASDLGDRDDAWR